MIGRKIRLFVCLIILIFAFFYLRSSILVLDDFHPPAGTGSGGSEALNAVSARADGWHIHVNLDEVTMYVFKNGHLVKTYPVSGGSPATPSPLGTWRIISKDTWGEGFGGAWLGFNVPWGKYGIHGTIYPGVIGRSNTSKGCIRMLNKDVKELYRLVPHGTTVTIVHGKRVFRTLREGNVGSDVYELQKALKKLGYYKGPADGIFGSGMTSSVRKFQKDNKLYQSGRINRQTYDRIMDKAREE